MLFPVHRFSIDDADGRVRLVQDRARRAWQRLLIVPSAWCVHESVPARQVRVWEQAGFARLQAQRLAPFPQTGGSAVVQGGQLRLWLWDERELDAALADAAPAVRSARRVAQAQLPSSLLGFGPWTRDLLADRGRVGASAGARIVQWATAASAASLLATGAYAAYAFIAMRSAEQRLAALQTQAGERGDQAQALSALSRAEQADRDWLEGYARAGASLDVNRLLRALSVPMEQHGVAIREIEVRQDDVRVVLVSAGIEIDLPALLRSMARVPGLVDVQLRQNADLSQATLSMRADGYYTAPQRVAVAKR